MTSKLVNILSGTKPINLKNVKIPSNLSILVLAPHPDDFDAIAITMKLLHDNGNDINLLVLTSGYSGVEDEFASCSDKNVKALIREKEQSESCKFFELTERSLHFLRLKVGDDGHLQNSDENLITLQMYWDKFLPDIVFLPHGNDTNHCHQVTYKHFQRIIKENKNEFAVLLNRDPKTINMKYDLYTPFRKSEAEWKGEMLRLHKSQHQRNLKNRGFGFDERILNVNREDAIKLTIDEGYAEVFELEIHSK